MALSSGPDPVAAKARLRAAALGRRAQMGAPARAAASAAAALRAVAALEEAAARRGHALAGCAVAMFASFRDEIDTAPLAALLRERGIALALPVIVGRARPLLFRRWAAGDPLAPAGAFAIPTPSEQSPPVVPDLVVVPLAAFDRSGARIGYGGGFYDRTLAGLRAHRRVPAIGFAFACQEVGAVPAQDHDAPLDAVVTETEIIDCAAR